MRLISERLSEKTFLLSLSKMTEEKYEVGLLFTELNGRCVQAPFLQLHIRGEIRTAPVRIRREQSFIL